MFLRCSVPQARRPSPSVTVPSSKLAKIEPRQAAIITNALTTETNTNSMQDIHRTPYLLVTTSVANSVVSPSRLMSPTHITRTTAAAQSLNNQPLYLIVGNCNSGSNSQPITSRVAHASTSLAAVVSHSSTSSALMVVSAAAPYLTVNGSGCGSGSGLVLQSAGVQPTGVMATLVLPSQPMLRVVADGSAQAVQYVLPSPSIQPATNYTLLVGNNSQLVTVQASSSSCASVGNSQANMVRPMSVSGNSKPTAVQLSSSCLSSHLPVIQPSVGNSESVAVRQLSSYYLPVGNSQLSCGVVGIPVSLVNSTLPQMVLQGQTATALQQSQSQMIHSTSLVSVSQ